MINGVLQFNISELISGNFTEAMENEKNQHQLQSESHRKRKSDLNIKGNLYKYMKDIPEFISEIIVIKIRP